jgi:hypothetical protein
VRSLGDYLYYILLMPSGENFSCTPQRYPVIRSGQPVLYQKGYYLVSVVFKGLLPRQADCISDSFHTHFDSSPLFYCYDLTVTLKALPPYVIIIPQ